MILAYCPHRSVRIIKFFFTRGELVRRRSALPVFAALSLSLMLPQGMAGAAAAESSPAVAGTVFEPPLAEGEVQQIGPGVYSTEAKSFEIYETDVPVGLMGRSHTVTVQPDGLSKPESAPDSRADMGVFGPGWEAEFVGGQLNRKLEQRDGSIVVTDLTVKAPVTYDLKSSLDFPDGGGVKKYATAEGSTLTETTRFSEATGTMVSTATEVIKVAGLKLTPELGQRVATLRG